MELASKFVFSLTIVTVIVLSIELAQADIVHERSGFHITKDFAWRMAGDGARNKAYEACGRQNARFDCASGRFLDYKCELGGIDG